MSDEWLDEQVRAAFEQVVLPKESLQRLKKKAKRHEPPSKVWIAVVLLAAALAVVIVAAWPEPAVAPQPAPAVPMPLPPREEPPAARLVRVVVVGNAPEVLIDDQLRARTELAIELPEGEHTFRLLGATGHRGEPVKIQVSPEPGVPVLRISPPALPPPVVLPPSPDAIPVRIVGDAAHALVDGTDRVNLGVEITLPEGQHKFCPVSATGELGRCVTYVLHPDRSSRPAEIELPSLTEPAPSPAPSGRPILTELPHVEGLWVGSTNSGRSFKLTILGQTGSTFEGTAELQLEDGTFESLAIRGEVDSAGGLTFQGGATSFQAKLDRRKLAGTYTRPGERAEPWTAYGGM